MLRICDINIQFLRLKLLRVNGNLVNFCVYWYEISLFGSLFWNNIYEISYFLFPLGITIFYHIYIQWLTKVLEHLLQKIFMNRYIMRKLLYILYYTHIYILFWNLINIAMWHYHRDCISEIWNEFENVYKRLQGIYCNIW